MNHICAVVLTCLMAHPTTALLLNQYPQQMVPGIARQEIPGQGGGVQCTAENLVWDLGMNNGMDSQSYMSQGLCVLAVEADPNLVAQARMDMARQLQSGQIIIEQAAISYDTNSYQNYHFFRNYCTSEWNSLTEAEGCRSCSWKPELFAGGKWCDKVEANLTSCSSLFKAYPTPVYMKMDMAGAEIGCLKTLAGFAQNAQRNKIPKYLSIETTLGGPDSRLELLRSIGYRQMKLVRQDTHPMESGPWGKDAPDCRTGQAWRSVDEVVQELDGMRLNGGDQSCPGPRGYEGVWYDVHAMLD